MRAFILSLMTLCVLSGPAWALDLVTAKAQGWVGETPTGLIAPRTQTPDVLDLVRTTNAGRMKIYQSTAAAQNVPVLQVQAIAGQKLQADAAPGDYIQMPNGSWRRK